jgi:hypothetical protein
VSPADSGDCHESRPAGLQLPDVTWPYLAVRALARGTAGLRQDKKRTCSPRPVRIADHEEEPSVVFGNILQRLRGVVVKVRSGILDAPEW